MVREKGGRVVKNKDTIKFNTIKEYWEYISKKILIGSDERKRKDFRYIFYYGSIAYRNIMAKINEMDETKFNEELAIKIITRLEKELDEFSKERI